MNSEKALQGRLKRHLERVGCLCYKFAAINRRGVPDLLVIPPSGKTFYIEVKNPNGKGRLTKLQDHQIGLIRERGADVFVVDDIVLADKIVSFVTRGVL